MTRARIEGLLAAFAKLVQPRSQHTFVETESVRYIYQSVEARLSRPLLCSPFLCPLVP
jgi:hypothetical protein